MWQVKDMVEFSDAVRGKGGRFVEAPVSGSKVPAETVRQPMHSPFGFQTFMRRHDKSHFRRPQFDTRPTP